MLHLKELARETFFRNNQVSPEIGEVTLRPKKPKKKGRKRKQHDGLQTKGSDRASAAGDHNGTIMGTQHGVAEVGVHKDGAHSEVEADDPDGHEGLLRMFKDAEAQYKHIRLQLQDLKDKQREESIRLDVADELMENQGMVGTQVMTEYNADMELAEGHTLVNDVNGSSDQAQLLYDKAAVQTRGDFSQHFQHAQETTEEVVGLEASSLITFNVEHQAAVNRLYVMGSVRILQNVISSLETMRSSGHDAPLTIRFTNAVLLEDGNVEIYAHAESKDDMERLSRIRGWDLEFEKSISIPAQSYAVETPRINIGSFNIQTRTHKVAAIEELLEENPRLRGCLRSVDDIRNIRWCTGQRQESSLIIELRTAQQANRVLDIGFLIRGKHYSCEFPRQKVRRCGRCQTFGHDQLSCSSAHRCGNCASQHATWQCVSSIRHCANCHGPHQTSDKNCPSMRAYRQTLHYTDHSAPVGETEHQELAPESKSQTANLSLPSSNPRPVAPHNESEIKVKKNDSLPNLGSVREHHRGGAAAPKHPSRRVNTRTEPHVRPENSEPTQVIGLAQNDPPDLTLLRRELEDLRMLVGELSGSQHQPQQRKRGPGQERGKLIKCLRVSHHPILARNQSVGHSAHIDPVPNHSPVPAD